MPTYDYKCPSCGYIEEKFHKITDDPVYQCPKCSCTMERQVGTGGHIAFHGSGFYQNDYKDAIKKDDIGPAKKKE